MNINGIGGWMSQAEIGKIHRATLEIISEVGMKIENDPLSKKLGDAGAIVNLNKQTVKFSKEFVEGFISESIPYDWKNHRCIVRSSAGIFEGKYLDPEGNYLSWTEELIAKYNKFAHYLDNVDEVNMLGCPIEGVKREVIPLYQRYICWKYGMRPGGSIWNVEFCPYILEMAEIMAEATGTNVKNYLDLGVYLISPLRFSRDETGQFMWFVERGYPVGISHMSTLGGSAPVTLAGAVSLYLAESLIINIIRRVLFDEKRLSFSCSISNIDMRTGAFSYGRPEKSIANVLMAQMARFYKGSFNAQAGQSDAKMPGHESAAQKVLLAIPSIIYGGCAGINAGLLSIDEVCSPIQMILDNELVGALRRFARGCSFGNDDFALDLIKEIGSRGLFTDKEHTVSHFRSELWEPRIWSRKLLSGWSSGDRKSDLERARDIYSDIESRGNIPIQISSETEKALKKVMEKDRKEIK